MKDVARVFKKCSAPVVVASLGALIGFSVPAGAGPDVVGRDVLRPSPAASLELAQSLAPYHLRVLAANAAATLVNVAWPDTSESNGSTFSLDLIYDWAGGGYVHVWQTNIPSSDLRAAGKDPTSDPGAEEIQVDSSRWHLVFFDRGENALVQMSTRTAEDITITLDGPRSMLRELKQAASALQ